MVKLPPKKASVKSPRKAGPKLPPIPAPPVSQPPLKKPKKMSGPSPSSGMPAPMGAPLL